MNKHKIVKALVLSLVVAHGMWSENAQGITVAPTNANDPAALVSAILGPGVSIVGTPTLIGVTNQQGTFSDGLAEIGFGSGIVLSTGNINQIPGENLNQRPGAMFPAIEALLVNDDSDEDISTDLGQPGDAVLTTLSGDNTFDANILEFSFEFSGGGGGNLFFNYVFASEEYIDFVRLEFNDVFGFFLDGNNIALVPGTTDPVTIKNISPDKNSNYYVNNIANTEGLPVAGLDFKFDGRTTVLTAQALGLGPGTHTIRMAVGDTFDHLVDTGVFIQGGTFSNIPLPPEPPEPLDEAVTPEPVTFTLSMIGLVALSLATRRRGA